jgi:micrococcal nuclease
MARVDVQAQAELLVGKRVAVCRCAGCASIFLTERRSARWCSAACRMAAFRAGKEEGMTEASYTYNALVVRVVDGDTVDVEVDLGFDVVRRERLRLLGINAPEVHGAGAEERARGLAAANVLSALLAGLRPEDFTEAQDEYAGRRVRVVVRTVKDKGDKYGRMLATVFDRNGRNVNDAMVMLGQAQPYAGGAR